MKTLFVWLSSFCFASSLMSSQTKVTFHMDKQEEHMRVRIINEELDHKLLQAVHDNDVRAVNCLLQGNEDNEVPDINAVGSIEYSFVGSSDGIKRDRTGYYTIYRSPLTHAACEGYKAIVKQLLDMGADINVQVPYSDMQKIPSTALTLAIRKQHGDIVKMFILAGACINVSDMYLLTDTKVLKDFTKSLVTYRKGLIKWLKEYLIIDLSNIVCAYALDSEVERKALQIGSAESFCIIQ